MHVYQFTTENIASYIADLHLANSHVAAIAGSGDFTLNAYMFGANRVDGVDVSPAACFYSELKICGAFALEYDEFIGFFATHGHATFGKSSFNHQTYVKLRPYLSSAATWFFDQLILPHGRHEHWRPGCLLLSATSRLNKIKRLSPYLLNQCAYRVAQSRVQPTLFQLSNVTAFLERGGALYDVVYLSNIHEFNVPAKELVIGASNMLREGGQVVLCEFGQHSSDAQRPEHLMRGDCWGLRQKVRCVNDGLSIGCIHAHIFEV